MKHSPKRTLASLLAASLLLVCMPGASSAAGLTVVDMNTNSAADLVTALVGSGVSVSNIALTGTNISSGTFAGGTGILGFEEGVVLGSGNVNHVTGPNTASNLSTALGTAGDADLSALAGVATQDATVLEFDFVPNGDTIHWQYVFASDEYNEWVGFNFNDVFGFFLNGTNVALVPGTSDVVSVNSINLGSNAAYYRNNALPSPTIDIAYDGLTAVLTISAPVNKDATNHMKLAIADGRDRIYDSTVFLKKGSFSTTPPPCTTLPSLTWESPLSATVPADVNAGDTLPITFRWMTCTGSTFDKSASIRVRDADTNALIAGYTYGYDILYNAGTGLYTQPFDTALHNIGAGRRLKVMVYFGGKLRGTAMVNVN
ncbi:MAG: hypothetical protein K0R39_2549 [Symbiobacteriaceae bacterium]|jgi:hypothetical protein|nr:hypothetical protein [Symbiobacteriaceae bacterium]